MFIPCWENNILSDVLDVQKLRMTYRIIGNFVGCLSALPRQDQLLGLPMQLTNEEVNLLVSKKLARMVKYDELDHPINCENAEQRKKMHKQSYLEQAILFREERKKQILSVADKIIEGKRKKKGGETIFDKQSAVNEELEKIPEMTEDAMMVQIFTSRPLLANFHPCHYIFIFFYIRATLGTKW